MYWTNPKTEYKIGDAEKSAIKRVLKNGFEACGIVPFNLNKVLSKVTPIDNSVNDITPLLASPNMYLKNKKSDVEVIKRRSKKRMN